MADGPGATGEYVRKHNPAISYTSISGNPTRCANITRLAGFDPAAADFEFIVPNQINDMHSSSVAAGDAFLKAFVPPITDSPAFADSVLFITWDEGATSLKGGGHIATIVVSPGMTPGSRFDEPANHYSMLRTIELAWGLPLPRRGPVGRAVDLPVVIALGRRSRPTPTGEVPSCGSRVAPGRRARPASSAVATMVWSPGTEGVMMRSAGSRARGEAWR